tara:strand:- start:1241 stop:2047 length:807 start_codon:yes stop_codon:yes gene_type:complete
MKSLKTYISEATKLTEFEGKTVTAYKLFNKKKDGRLYPLYVNKNTPVEMGVWLPAEEGERAKDNKSGGRMVKSSLGDLAYRPGWHAGDYPMATHIGGKSKGKSQNEPDYRPDNQVWAEVEMSDEVDWQARADANGTVLKSGPFKGQISAKSKAITDQLPKGGHYRFKTNNNMTGDWIIGGELRVVREISDDEVKAINSKGGHADLPRLHELQAAGEKDKVDPAADTPKTKVEPKTADQLKAQPSIAPASPETNDELDRVKELAGIKST